MQKLTLSLTFQNDADANRWAQLDPRVRCMVWEVAYLAKRFNYAVVVTSSFRADGIHATGSAVDIDFVDHGEEPSMDYIAFGRMAARYINRTYEYGRSWWGDSKPAALWHGGDSEDHRGGWHLHLQAPSGRPMRLLP